MAQTGYTPISIYYSATTTNVPTAGNLVAGELAINTADGKLFYKDSSGVVQTIASKTGIAAGSNTQVQYNSSGSLAGSANMVFDGSTLTTLNSAYTGTLTGGTGVIAIGTNQIYKDASGNVGIGGTPVRGILDIFGGASGRMNLRGNTSDGKAVFTLGDATYPTATINTPYSGGTLNLGGSGGGVTIGTTGNMTFTASNAGIVFNNSSALTNSTLNDYETGTWTPVFVGGSGITYQSQVGLYTKIGNMVYFSCNFRWSALTGTINTMSGLPFTCSNISEASYGMDVVPYINSGLALPGSTTYIIGYVARNTTNISFYGQPNSSNANFQSSGNIYFSGYYQATF
jgi:hypothetical protein